MLRILLEGGFVRILCKRLYGKMSKKIIIAVMAGTCTEEFNLSK